GTRDGHHAAAATSRNTAVISTKVRILPSQETEIRPPSAAPVARTTIATSSTTMSASAVQGSSPASARESTIAASPMRSAIGSMIAPVRLVWSSARASSPSTQSVEAQTSSSTTARVSGPSTSSTHTGASITNRTRVTRFGTVAQSGRVEVLMGSAGPRAPAAGHGDHGREEERDHQAQALDDPAGDLRDAADHRRQQHPAADALAQERRGQHPPQAAQHQQREPRSRRRPQEHAGDDLEHRPEDQPHGEGHPEQLELHAVRG